MTHTPRILVVINSESSGPRRLTEWLGGMGIELVLRSAKDGLPETLDGYHGLVLLGGGFMPDDFERAPWLHVERSLAQEAITDDVPTLGICLGAQIIADVAGGEVRASHGPKERGSTLIHTTERGSADPVLGALGEAAPMIENHEDMITVLPPGAVLLASSDAVENQAFALGRHVRGVQFHPEASAESLRQWNEAALRDQGYDVQAMFDAADADHADNTRASRALVEAFGREVQERAAADAALTTAFAQHDQASAPAVLAAVFDRGGVRAWHGVGSPEQPGSTVARGTVFRIASMTKSFLAATALALRDDGLLNFTAPVTDYVPGIRFMFDGAHQPVTIAQLLTNQSGLPEDNAWGDRRLGDRVEAIEALAAAGLRLTAEPGDIYQYSNLGMSFVGRAIEAVTGQPVERVIHDRFIAPLELEHTAFSASEYPEGAQLAWGYRSFDGLETIVREPYVGNGALACIGGLFSTVDDVAAWSAFLSSAYTDAPLRPELLAASTRREMQRVHTVSAPGAQQQGRPLDAVGYGIGLVVEHDRTVGRIVHHSGGLPGFSSHMRWNPATGLGAVAFGNCDMFKAETLATVALDETLASRGFAAVSSQSPRVTTPWAETLTAAERIDATLRAGEPLAALDGVFAVNVMQDIPAEVRERRLGEALAKTGAILAKQQPFADRVMISVGPAELRWRIACERGALVCDARLVGLSEPLVQTFIVTVEGKSDTAPAE